VNAASLLSNPPGISPGEIITIFGRNLGPVQLVSARLNAAGLIDNTLDRTQVFFDGVAAPLIYVRTDQVSAVVPYEVSGASAVTVSYGGMRSLPVSLRILPTVPGVFTANSSGTGPVAAVNQDGSFNSAANPAPRGSIVTFYATGEGNTDPAGINGKLAAPPLPAPILKVGVNIETLDSDVTYAGAAPGLVSGLVQINARVPAGVRPGSEVPLMIRVGDSYCQRGVTLAIR